MAEDDRCEQCGSRSFYVDEDGRTYCENGHEQARGVIVEEDDADFGQRGKTLRKKEAKEKQKFSRVLRGSKAYQLYLQSWQYILWKQCHALVHQKGLPAELWTIVRDLWTLWLSRLERRLQPSTSATEVDTEGDPATTSGNETTTDSESAEESKLGRKRKQTQENPSLIDTIALTYLGVLLLRRPIGLATVLRWIQQEDIPYIRAIRHVPQEMKDRLPPEYHMSLDTIRLLEADDLQIAIFRQAQMYNSSFGMIMPPLNINLFLLNYVRSLALPLEVYVTVRRLSTISRYNFSYPDAGTAATTRRQATTFPEAQLMSLVVIATKLLFPFDSQTVKRYPRDPNDPMTLRLDWAAWLNAKGRFDKGSEKMTEPDSLKPGSEIHVTDKDVFNMSDKQLDQYMDWFQRSWISPTSTQAQQSNENALDKEILDMFPLHHVPEPVKTRGQHQQARAVEQERLNTRIHEVQGTLLPRRAISLEEEAKRGIAVLRPGAKYPRFFHVDELEKTDKVVRIFHAEAARTACLGLKTLLRAVNKSEDKIERWLREQRRQEVFGEEYPAEEHELPATRPPTASGTLARNMEGMELGRTLGPDTQEDEMPATSLPTASGTLARNMEGLELGQTLDPDAQEDVDVNAFIDMKLLPELERSLADF
ncbi:hypothetical protein PV11_05331 [Exophiala sideris]|uniref:Uncharacterized protein n=1 Tax=Exophiala sideris TaxID=1016849 RepID=A0A0D1Z949_9EURO|nr:hypothetical protein PV11_05331 [Exophiala sideris]